jgi:hypothetical protein
LAFFFFTRLNGHGFAPDDSRHPGKVFVGGITWETSSDELRTFFEAFGTVLQAIVIFDPQTQRNKGYDMVMVGETLLFDEFIYLIISSKKKKLL